MLWNTFEKDFEKLDRLHNPNYEPDSGLTDFDEIQESLHAMRKELDGKGESHAKVFSKIAEHIFHDCAVEVNPVDWFGVSIAGWEPDCRRRPWRMMQFIIYEWEKEQYLKDEEGQKIQDLRLLHIQTGAGWSYPDNCHSKPYWDDILKLGIRGLMDRVEYYRDKKIADGEYTEEMRDYYESVLRVYEGFVHLLGRWAHYAKSKSEQNEKMPLLYKALTNIMSKPPETFYECLLLIYVYSVVQEYVTGIQARTLGNLDTLLRPYYEKELAEGTLTRENAKELVKYFYMQYENAGNINNQPIFFAGTDGRGHDLVNDLSFVFIEAYGELNIISPKVQIAVSEVTNREFLKKCCELLRAGHTSFAFVNEDLARASMDIFTDDEEDKKSLSLSGCYNFSLKENIQPESAGISFVKGIELTLNNGTDPLSGKKLGLQTGEISDFDTFEKFYDAYILQTKKLVDDAVIISEYYDKHFGDVSPAPMLSANFESSVSTGKDVYFNGSKYHNTVITVSCLASAVDSLYAVKKYVYDKKEITLDELKKALAANWEGYEKLRTKIANDTEKYGNNIDKVDFLATDIMKKTADYIYSKRTYLGQSYAADGEGINHGITYGKSTGATPDGRFAHDQLSKNLQSVFGCDRRGVLAYINSATKIDAYFWPNGAPIDFVLHPSAVNGDEGLDIMVSLITTTFKKGGAAIQGNVYNAELLKEAQKNPDKYKGLQVRLCGWSMYFNRLSRDEQDMLIRQAESAS